MQSIVELVRDLLIFVVAMFALLIALIIIVSKMRDDNPLKHILSALSYRVGATVAAGALAIPIEPIPGLDAVYDIGAPIALIWYWFTFLEMQQGGQGRRHEKLTRSHRVVEFRREAY